MEPRSRPALSLEGVTFKIGRARLLTDVTLDFRRMEVTAIIGPSGSGKSTLLKCLTTTHRPSKGKVLVGGRDAWEIRRQYRIELGYVPQDDVIHRQLTVDQAFYYASKLRLDTALDGPAVRRRIDSIAQLLGLTEHRRQRIYRLSGGQRKRVNIGIELLADPPVLILDEPASGLDPGTEEDLVKLLGSLARSGRTVVMTTHSMEYLDAVDRIVLVISGNVVFAGNLRELLAHFRVAHPAEVFKAVRQRELDHWVSCYRAGSV
ncbi:MAG TPA: hypothetical protein DD417_11770 [Elusimicrobia bacterium]|nr:hypothetical protein [Elusimicrobiota bacterium]